MKRFFTVFVFLGALLTVQAQFVDFGSEYDIQRGVFAVADIDGDGDLDIIFSGEDNGDPRLEKGAILINDGAGNFTVQVGERVIRIGKSGNIQFGDIDGDGDLDVIFAGWQATNISPAPCAGIALNDGHGVYTLADAYPINPAGTITSCGFADFNLDGLLDYYFFANGEGNCIIYFQQADGSFEPSTESFGQCKFVEPEVTVVDFDNDRYPDIFISAFDDITATRFSALFKNDGFGVFTQFAGVDIFKKKANGTSSWGDFNGDGYLDLLLNGDGYLNSGEDNDGIIRIYKNEGGNSTSVAQTYEWYRQNGVGNGSIIVDWDNDGDLDFFVGGWNGAKQQTALYLCDNPANFTFTKSALSDTYFPGVSEQGYYVADLNGDNKVDLLICGYSGGTGDFNRRIAGYMINQSSNASVLPAAPTNLNAIIDESEGVMITFSWNAPQSETGKYGTTYNLALKNTTTGKWLYNPMAVVGGQKNGWRQVAGRMGNVYTNTAYELYDLPEGNYEWTVQAINGAYLGGAFAETKTFTIGGTSINKINKYKPTVYTSGNKLIVKGAAGDVQSLKVYGISGVSLAATTFTGNTEIELPTGVYIIELEKTGAVPFRTKALLK
jgi:hypothetical protein